MPSFLLPAGLGLPDLLERLAPLGALEAGVDVASRRTFLDTFDWRLHRAGWSLESVGDDARGQLRLRPLDGGPPLARHAGPTIRFARELPAGALRDLLEPVLHPRALLAIATADVTETPIAVRSTPGRTMTRLVLVAVRVALPGAVPFLPLRPVLTVPPGPRAAAVSALCAAWPDCEPAPPDRIAAVLEPLGRSPRDYSGKVKVPLDGSLPARDAARALLLHLLVTLEANVSGVRTDLDPEFLHDLRVAVRRTRSALGQIKGVLPPATAARFTREFSWLQELTGPARDLDVFVLELPALGRLLSPRSRRSLGPLARLLERRRRSAYADLARAMDSPRFSRLLLDWRVFLLQPTPKRPSGAPNALRPCVELAVERIGKLHRRAVREGAAIGAASPAADLHELRKTCKKLRYLVEFFHSLLDRDVAEAAIASLKGLQDTLGNFQDLQVQADALLGYARELARDGKAPPPTYIALGMLVERLREEQARARVEFAGRFGEFAHKAGRKSWKRLLATAAKVGAANPNASAPHGSEGRRG
ncbi:MAG: CHAD domain-containing protein [Candidatus Methylomirabilia bacterium]